MFLFIFLCGAGIYAQTINGVVNGEDGITSATVQIKGTDTGVTTDLMEIFLLM